MKRFFWKFFPKKTESMNVFVDFVLRNRCTRVEVAPMTSVLAQLGLPGVSLFVLFSVEMDDIGTAYYVCCTAITSRGEKMVYEYKRVARYVPQREYAADHERCALEIFLEAEQCASLLDYRLGTVRVELLGSSGMPMSKTTREDLHRRAMSK